MQDLTVIYLTASEINENFAEYQRRVLVDAIGDYPLISISRKPLDFGQNILDNGERGYSNIYRQMLRAAKVATTPFIATAEDDTLYPKEHYNFYRPEKDTFAYNNSRWALFTWGVPTYSWRNRKSNCSLIAPRELAIEALEERFEKYPDGTPPGKTGEMGRWRVEKQLGLTLRKSVDVYCGVPIIQLNHDSAIEDRQARHRKRMGPLKAYDIPFWGKAEDIVSYYK